MNQMKQNRKNLLKILSSGYEVASYCISMLIGTILVSGIILIFSSNLFEASSDIKVVIIGISVLFTILLFNLKKYHKRNIKAKHFSEKASSYKEFISLLESIVLAINENLEMPEEKVIQSTIQNFYTNIIILGSPEIIISLIDFEDILSQNQENEMILSSIENLLIEIRKDLGYNDGKSLNNKELIHYFSFKRKEA